MNLVKRKVFIFFFINYKSILFPKGGFFKSSDRVQRRFLEGYFVNSFTVS